MADKQQIRIDQRSALGKWKMRRLRAEGIVPGVVYGHGQETIAVQLSGRELLGLIRRGTRVVELTGNGSPETAFIRDLQWDTFGHEILHVDFARVAADEKIEVEVRVELRGTAPGVEEGGVLAQLVHTVEVECLATDIPGEIRVDVRQLHLDQAIHVRDLTMPPGVRMLADPDVVVVHITKKLEEAEPAPEEAVVGPAEPEIVGRRVAEEAAETEEK